MAVNIRQLPANSPDCPRDEAWTCDTDRDHFDVTVLKNLGGEARPIHVHVYGLPFDEKLDVTRVLSSDCDPMFCEMFCGGRPVQLDYCHPEMLLVVPGTYRFSTASGEFLDPDEFAVEVTPLHTEYAMLFLKQQEACRQVG